VSIIRKTGATSAPSAVILIRIVVGWVFFSEGIQKFLFPAALGVGRFAKLGLPHPQFLAPFVGIVEILFGALLVFGIATRLATIPLLIDIGVAIWKTKMPMLAKQGFWVMAHEARIDYCMLFCLLFLLIVGAGRLSFDAQA
jgi:putative oxidoreductase